MEVTARIFYTIAQEMFQKYSKNKITLEEFAVLEAFVCYPHLNAGTLAKTLIREKSYVESILAKLIKKKLLLEVKPKNNDIQVQYYKLKDLGERLYNENAPGYDKMIELLAKFINKNELISFTRTLMKIRNILISVRYEV